MSSVSILLLCTLAVASSLVIPQKNVQDRGLVLNGQLCPQCNDFIARGYSTLQNNPGYQFGQKWIDFTCDHECNNLGVIAGQCQTAFHQAAKALIKHIVCGQKDPCKTENFCN